MSSPFILSVSCLILRPAACRPSKNRWFYASDSMVRPTDLQSVLSAEAYLLFYQRDTPYSEPPPRALAPATTAVANGNGHAEGAQRAAGAGAGVDPGHRGDSGSAAENGGPASPAVLTNGARIAADEGLPPRESGGDASPEASSTPVPDESPVRDGDDTSACGSAAAQDLLVEAADSAAGGEGVRKTLLLLGAGTDDAEASIHGGQPR